MGLEEDYREGVENIEEGLESRFSQKRASRAKKILDQLLPFALIGIGSIITVMFVLPVNPGTRTAVNLLNYGLIIYFSARLVVAARLATSRKQFFEQHWLDFLLIIPVFSIMREARVGRAIAEFLPFEEEALLGAYIGRLSIAGKLTKISRIVKRSVGF
ncbi:MAG: hypothetical protein H8Z69_05240 [Nanohaloarchaea archaeon]|nr:hypothetical protein [Candidatus Nanohaloarchaea archaeon]